MALHSLSITLAEHVRLIQEKLYSEIFRMVVEDGTAGFDGIDVTYGIKYRPGDNVGDKVAEVTAYFQNQIDIYKAAKAIEEHPQTTTAISDIQNGLVI